MNVFDKQKYEYNEKDDDDDEDEDEDDEEGEEIPIIIPECMELRKSMHELMEVTKNKSIDINFIKNIVVYITSNIKNLEYCNFHNDKNYKIEISPDYINSLFIINKFSDYNEKYPSVVYQIIDNSIEKILSTSVKYYDSIETIYVTQGINIDYISKGILKSCMLCPNKVHDKVQTSLEFIVSLIIAALNGRFEFSQIVDFININDYNIIKKMHFAIEYYISHYYQMGKNRNAYFLSDLNKDQNLNLNDVNHIIILQLRQKTCG